MSVRTLTYDRTYSFFEPDYTYNVTDETTGKSIGSVARLKGERRWHASNIRWASFDEPGPTAGGELARTFPTRYDAAVALRYIADGRDPDEFGGYVTKEKESA